MPDVIEQTTAGLDAALDREVTCARSVCGRPASVRARIHLPRRRSVPATGCETRTVFLCLDCLALLRTRVMKSLPYTCHCQHVIRHVSEVILWVRSLR